MIAQDSKKHLARLLRRRLEGRVPSHILNQLSDDELIERYNEHHAFKLQAARDVQAAQEPATNGSRRWEHKVDFMMGGKRILIPKESIDRLIDAELQQGAA